MLFVIVFEWAGCRVCAASRYGFTTRMASASVMRMTT
jgi:hypothetical protein